jgi:hypothetical protein
MEAAICDPQLGLAQRDGVSIDASDIVPCAKGTNGSSRSTAGAVA